MSPFNVADRSQLFVDRILVRRTENVAFTLHPARKHPVNPLVKAERPWEGWRLEIYGNVIYDEDEKIFKMWYLGEDPKRFCHYAAYYAISRDGVHWDKPLVGTVRVKGLAGHNVVANQVILPSVIKDRAEPDPSRRYKMICWLQKDHAYHTMVSPDGRDEQRRTLRVRVQKELIRAGCWNERNPIRDATVRTSKSCGFEARGGS